MIHYYGTQIRQYYRILRVSNRILVRNRSPNFQFFFFFIVLISSKTQLQTASQVLRTPGSGNSSQ